MSLFRGRYRNESARKPGWDYPSPGYYLATIVTRNRRPWLGVLRGVRVPLRPAGSALRAVVESIPAHFPHVTVHAWAIQPDHVHLLLHFRRTGPVPRSRAAAAAAPYRTLPGGLRKGSLSKVIQAVKAAVTHEMRRQGNQAFAWQSRFHDRVLSDPGAVAAAAGYVNRHAPVTDPSRRRTMVAIGGPPES